MALSSRERIDIAISYVLGHGRLRGAALRRDKFKDLADEYIISSMHAYVQRHVLESNSVPAQKEEVKRYNLNYVAKEVETQLGLFDALREHVTSGTFNRVRAANESLIRLLTFFERDVSREDKNFLEHYGVPVRKKTSPKTIARMKADFEALVREHLMAW